MRKVTVSRMRERYAQAVLTFRITYVFVTLFACTQSQSSRAPPGTTQVCRCYTFGWTLNEDKQTDTTGACATYLEVTKYFGYRPGNSVGILTDYGLDGSGIESRCGRDFPPVRTGPGAHPASCKISIGSFPGVKCARGVLLTTHPL